MALPALQAAGSAGNAPGGHPGGAIRPPFIATGNDGGVGGNLKFELRMIDTTGNIVFNSYGLVREYHLQAMHETQHWANMPP